MRVRLRKMREAYGLTQQALSEAVGISRPHYVQIESGNKTPSLPLAIKIKNALSYYNDDLFDNVSAPAAAPKRQE